MVKRISFVYLFAIHATGTWVHLAFDAYIRITQLNNTITILHPLMLDSISFLLTSTPKLFFFRTTLYA